MAVFTYFAKRSIIGGHTLGDDYSIEIDLQTIDPKRASRTAKKTALNGTTIETVYQNNTEGWSILTDHIALGASEDLPLEWVEFLDSVAGGEAFDFDALGTIASPRNVQSVKMQGNSQFQRVGTTQNMTVSFDMLVIG
jgi:hypothetical protein